MITAERIDKNPVKPDIHFGTDGWRGVMADDFTIANVRRITQATASWIQKQAGLPPAPILIGYDRRFLSKEFAECVAQTFLSQGIPSKIVSSPMPTPALSVCVTHWKAPLGVMITASHNPAIYNGFKLKDRMGRSAPPDITQQIEHQLQDGNGLPETPLSPPILFDFRDIYETYLRQRLDGSILKRARVSVVLDHLHGAASGIPEHLLRSTTVSLSTLHAERDPLFGGLHPEPIEENLKPLQREVKRRRAVLGLAFDGDADRLGVVDERGRYLTPHQVFPLLVLYCIEQKGWTGKIVQSVSLGVLAERIAKAYTLPFEEVAVGFKHVAERMISEDVLAGGEESGGYALRGGLPERDGILSGLLFLEMIAATGRKPSELLKDMEKRFGAVRFKRHDFTLASPIPDKNAFIARITRQLPDTLLGQSIARIRSDDGLKIVLENGSWLLLRPSGTEPLLRTYAETESWEKTRTLLSLARRWIQDDSQSGSSS